MKKSIKRMIAVLTLALLVLSFVPAPLEAQAASEFYGDYTDAAKIYDYGSCPSMQGLAVGSQKLYTIKIKTDNTAAFISMTDKDSGDTTKLYNADAGSYYFTYLDHANDMDVWGIDGYSNLFITSTLEGSNAIVRLKRDGNNLTKVASYSLTYNGAATCATALAIKSVSNGVITFITKLGMNLYTGSVSTGATSANIELTKLCSISKSKVYIKGEYLDLSSFVNQGMGYHNGNLYVPISGDDNWLNRSVIMVFNLQNPQRTILPSEAIVFRVTSGAYSALFEIESCDICSGDGKLYFNTNRRKTNSDTNHDGVSSIDNYTFVKLTDTPKYHVFTLRYDANGGTGTMADTVVDYGYSTPIRTNTFTKSGGKFLGWTAYRTSQDKWYYTNGSSTGWYAEGSQPSGYTKYIYKDGQKVSATSSVPDDVVMMYAQWGTSTYTVRYDANGGTGTMEDTLVTYGVSTNLRTNTFTRPDYNFVGWNAYRTAQDQWYYTNGTSSGWYAEGSQPSGYTKTVYKDGVAVAKTTAVDNDLTIFYAQWEANDYTVTFKSEDGTVLSSGIYAAGSTVTPPTAPTKAYDSDNHYTFAGWDEPVTTVTGDATYTATYTAEAHSYTSEVIIEATCTENGAKTYSCTCGYSYTESIPAAGHSHTATVTPPTCTEVGYTTYTCACGDTYTADEVAALGHKYETVTIDATCTTDGSITDTCTTCGDTKVEVIPAAGHSYEAVVTAPTCTEAGYTTYTCACGDTYTADEAAALGHNYETVTIDATCTADGSITDTCTTCGDTKVEVIPAAGHSYEAVVTAPTCTETGYTTYTCACGDTYTADEVAALGHSYESGACTVCGAADPDYVEPVVQPTLSLKYPTVSFEDVIVMNVYYTAENLEDVVEMGLITYSSEVTEWNVDNAEAVVPGYSYVTSKKMYMSSTEGIAAKNLGDTLYFSVYAKLSDGSYQYTKPVSYSPETYAYSQLATGAADIKPLVVAMLKYGAAAQTFFNHNTDALVDRNLTAEQLALIEDYRSDMMTAVATPDTAKQGEFAANGGITRKYPTVSFEGAFEINYYCVPANTPVDGVTMYYWNQADYDAAEVLTAENATAAIEMNGTDTYQAAIKGIAAKDLDKGIYVAFVYSDGTTTYSSGVLAYSIGTYCNASVSGEAGDLAMATAVYGYHAKLAFYKLAEPTV